MQAGLAQELRDPTVDDEEFLVFHRAESVENDTNASGSRRILRRLLKESAHQHLGQAVGRWNVLLVDA